METRRPSRRILGLIAGVACVATATFAAPAAEANPYPDDWPRHDARWTFEIVKDPSADPPPHEPSDLAWLHLHRNHPTLNDALVNTIKPRIVYGYDELAPVDANIEVRYWMRDVAISGWLSAPFEFVLDIDNPALARLQDGVHDLTITARGPGRNEIKPLPAFVHLSRDKAFGEPFGFDDSVPIVNIVQENPTEYWAFGPGIAYAHPDERNHIGFPVDPTAVPWSTSPLDADLYQEAMAPHSELFGAIQLWWDHPGHEGQPFVRGMTPKHSEDHRGLRVDFAHEKFPMMDGPPGVGWMSPYVSGAVDSQGRFAFAEAGGRVGWLMPDGEIVTIAGWRVKPNHDPMWWGKPLDIVRRNMENLGNWSGGRGEFFTPLDVAIDPNDENVLYVAAYEDHVIWKVVAPSSPGQVATISVLAGSPDHEPGFADGGPDAARFNGPASLTFDPVSDTLLVADQDNDAIRRVTRNGRVTTVAGRPGHQQRMIDAGIDWTDQLASRGVSQFEVTAAEAAAGVRPDIYLPQTIRVDSRGRILLLEIGFGAIRRLDPSTGVVETLDEVQQKHRQYDRGWAWFDVDRWGNSGPVDGIYWTKFVSTLPGEHFNEVYRWLPPDGGPSVNLFPTRGTGLYPDGWGRRAQTNPPHYGWLVAVDPRGGVLLSGGGEHGLTRLRPRRTSDPVEDPELYWLGRQVWMSGAPIDAEVTSASLALRHGWSGHNHLGLTDAWSLEGATDRQLLDAFDVPAAIRNDAEATRQLLAFIRPNTMGRSTVAAPPPPRPTPRPTTPPRPTPPAATPTPAPPSPTSRPAPTPAPARPTCDGRTATIVMPGFGGTIRGTNGDDVIIGTAGPDTIDGRGGDDVICGLGGGDHIRGGSGRDRIHGAGGDDRLFGDDDIDYLFGGAGIDTIEGGGGSDRLRGHDGDDHLIGGSGADRMWGGPGDDELHGQGGQDQMWGGAGDDRMQGNWQSDDLWGGSGSDTIGGAEGKDFLDGGPGPDTLYGGRNSDELHGGAGADTLSGGQGTDELHGGPDRDHLNGGPHTDTCFGEAADTMQSCQIRMRK